MDDQPEERHLDDLEQQAAFWVRIIEASSAPEPPEPEMSYADMGDLRETLLEGQLDLTPERVSEVYYASCGSQDWLQRAQLGDCLRRCGVTWLQEEHIAMLVEKVAPSGCEEELGLKEFESVLSRLLIAQQLRNVVRRWTASSEAVASKLTVIDYNTHGSSLVHVADTQQLLQYFFGHRPPPVGEASWVRWVHLGHGHDPKLLFALMVKYSLHPLAVEDAICQCPAKIERYGANYMVAIEHLVVVSSKDGDEPVNVSGHHVCIFGSGSPMFDTVVTLTQQDRNFAAEWPSTNEDSPPPYEEEAGHAWVERLRRRLGVTKARAVRSRLCERRADFLLYQIVDLCADDLLEVTRAYSLRLCRLEAQMPAFNVGSVSTSLFEVFNEVSLAERELMLVLSRIRGLRRLLRRAIDDEDLSAGLWGYLQDVADHVDEAYEDAGHLSEKCRSILKAFERALEFQQLKTWQRAEADLRVLERQQMLREEQLNKVLFVLTAFTTIFAPLQFVAGVYGMNFVDYSGTPTIPELLWPSGYMGFWIFALLYLTFASVSSVVFYKRFVRPRDDMLQVKNLAPVRDGALAQAAPTLDDDQVFAKASTIYFNNLATPLLHGVPPE